jgi:hypothetical protein
VQRDFCQNLKKMEGAKKLNKSELAMVEYYQSQGLSPELLEFRKEKEEPQEWRCRHKNCKDHDFVVYTKTDCLERHHHANHWTIEQLTDHYRTKVHEIVKEIDEDPNDFVVKYVVGGPQITCLKCSPHTEFMFTTKGKLVSHCKQAKIHTGELNDRQIKKKRAREDATKKVIEEAKTKIQKLQEEIHELEKSI